MVTPESLRNSATAELIRASRLVVVLRRLASKDQSILTVRGLADSGARVFEITLDSPDAAWTLTAVKQELNHRTDGPYAVGAGTILDQTLVYQARDAGADFLVSPIHDPGALRTSLALDLPFVSGCFSPSEAFSAWKAGATFIKLFPASSLGPSFVRELRGPLPELEAIPTGGIDRANGPSFISAGAVAVGIGTALIRAEASERASIVAAITRGAG